MKSSSEFSQNVFNTGDKLIINTDNNIRLIISELYHLGQNV